MGLIGRK